MTINWYVDEGVATLGTEWKKEHPGAVVYYVGDASHASRDSEHNPEPAGSLPGADYGEVDAADFMIGHGVVKQDLRDLADGLVRSRDKRILYVIFDGKICSSHAVGSTPAWTWRTYTGSDQHTDHVHLSVNDLFDDNTSDWYWEKLMARTIPYVALPTGAKLPTLQFGDEDDNQDGWNHVGRAQALANWINGSVADIDCDGVYGKDTVAKMKAIFGGDGKKLTIENMRTLHGI